MVSVDAKERSLDSKFDRNKKRQETDYSGKRHFLPEYLVLLDHFKTSQIQNLVFFIQKKIVKHALRIFIGWNLQPVIMNFGRKKDVDVSYLYVIARTLKNSHFEKIHIFSVKTPSEEY